MLLTINGKEQEIRSAPTLSDLIRELEIEAPHFAVAVNQEVVPKSKYEATPLKEGDQIEFVHAVGGGCSPQGQ